MNIPESRDFVVKYRPICCDRQVDTLGYNVSSSCQHFICRGCDKRITINYWPLYEEKIRELRLNSILK